MCLPSHVTGRYPNADMISDFDIYIYLTFLELIGRWHIKTNMTRIRIYIDKVLKYNKV